MINKRFEELKLSGKLPSPSGMGIVILRHCQSDGAPVDELLRVLEMDPALTSRLLKQANACTDFGQAPVTTVAQATDRLGARFVRNVALSFSVVPSPRSTHSAQFDFDRYWSSCLACAAAARSLCRRRSTGDPSEAYTCGLLIDIGTLALVTVHTESYVRILQQCDGTSDADRLAAENRAFAIQHWEVTAALMEDCGLPESLIEVALGQSEEHASATTLESSAHEMRQSIVTARRIASLITAGVDRLDPRDERYAAELARIQSESALPTSELTALFEECAREWRESCQALRISPKSAASSIPVVRVDDVAVAAPSDELFADAIDDVREPSLQDLVADDPSDTTILVVDDDQRLLRLVAHYLEQSGYSILQAPNGELALELALAETPDIVVTDWSMPGMSGIELCRALRASSSCSDAYVVMLTAREEEQRLVEAFDAGADDYVSKPFSPRILLARVQAGRRINQLHRQVESDRHVRAKQVKALGLATRQLQSAVLTDLLTELPNRRYALTRLEQEVETAVRLGRPLSLIMVDIDHFKEFNDNYGHDVGDHVLRSTAFVLRSTTRRGDVVCRLGGEEFLVINVNSAAPGALVCAERLRAAVEENEIRIGGRSFRVTVSLGVAERPPEMCDLDELLKSADQAVYQAKAAGRNTARILGLDGPATRSA